MSWIIAARYVHRPRIARRCDDCGRRLGPHIYLYGRAHDTDPPSAMRLCASHLDAMTHHKAMTHPKIVAALAEGARRTPDEEAA